MNRKMRIFLLVPLSIMIAAILTSNHCDYKTTLVDNPNLLASHLEFQYPQNAEIRFKQLLTNTELAGNFKQDRVNSFYEKSPWLGRLHYNGISYQAFFAIDCSKTSYRIRNPQASGLHFSIFHPPSSNLTYTISIRDENSSHTLFSKSFNSQSFYEGFIPFERELEGDKNLVFETEGTGIGAWINPRFHVKKEKPRVFILVVLDTLRCDHTSLYGYHRRTTPFLEKLAADGVKFNRAFSSTSWTLPAHVSLFSGKDLSQHGVVAPRDTIPGDYPLLAEIFQSKGYVTAAFTGGGFVEDSYGFFRGFQYYSNEPGNVFSMNSAERVFNHFKKYCERFWGNDLFIFLHTYQLHAPYKAPRPYIDKINAKLQVNLVGLTNFVKHKHEYYKALSEEDRQNLIDLYDAAILYADEALVGNVMNHLKGRGAYEDAMIAVLSDHGEEFYDHGSWEHGHTLYNELIKIPLVINYPALAEKKGIQESLVSITDIPGIMLQQSGLSYDNTQFEVKIGEPQRVLPVLFPVSPIIPQFLSKIALVSDQYYFIYNQTDEKKTAFFNPPPAQIPLFELYRKTDLSEKNNIYDTGMPELNGFRQEVQWFRERLKHQQQKLRSLDTDLEKKLKSLGYLDG
jgi:hypothetical protein